MAALVLAGASAPAFAQTSRMRVGDQTYEMIRDLADYVESGSQFTLEQTQDKVRAGGIDTRERQLLTALEDFNRRAEGFLDKVDDSEARPFTVTNDVNSLRTVARQVNTRLRRVRAVNDLRDDWAAVMDGIERMRRAMAGQTVSLPAQRSDWAWYGADNDDRSDNRNNNRWRNRPAARVSVLRGQPLTDFRALTQDFNTRLQRVLAVVEQDNSWRNRQDREQVVERLRRLQSASTQIHGRTYTSELNARTVADDVEQLRQDARSMDPMVRRFGNAEAEWNAGLTVLERMGTMVGLSGSGTMGGQVGNRPGTDVFSGGTSGGVFGGTATALSTRDIAEFRRLAHELDDQVGRVSEMADRDYPGRRERMLTELEQLAARADTLRRQTETGTFDVAAIDGVIDQLQADARDVDDRLRRGRVFETTWDEWNRVLQILEAMDRVVHR